MAAQLQALLRFLSQDAKVPLASAMGKIKDLQAAGLQNVDDISTSNLETLQSIFKDGKIAKQVHNAAKRVAKEGVQKRGASDDGQATTDKSSSTTKKMKFSNESGGNRTPYEIEYSLTLPITSEPEEVLSKTILKTNRAPLVLAFAVAVTKYTMPEQPLSSRLSLAQTVVSANSRSKAISLGIESSAAAVDEEGKGQPTVRVLGREISVLKRWDYDPDEGRPEGDDAVDEILSNSTTNTGLPPLWGLDLEALRKRDSVSAKGNPGYRSTSNLPIHTPEVARSYLLKSFTMMKEIDDNTEKADTSKKKKPRESTAEKERCLGLLLQVLDILFSSWASTLSAEELDRRAWTWYVRVRPEVQAGVAGWGEKGRLNLADILSLKR
ncbi:conserved hypothetical protein [Talaromyces stipitatus ATCC 10500]|uniref:Impact N-terminal domain-containing protein n=1 Tax=Talaromyces stipitatus (strain ATCC 10500 / CBS 375.48 / QM 6759 / NRRL 1006) TaxID=441959 RepID=B8M4H9_TALSN|nr:uncharacterized protein TSTA_024960 [Talaromyces stipitatus ATCC 10500]EED19174.1 conserved hypothetical protein [Talaromyces stipitatus ATCC 10500]